MKFLKVIFALFIVLGIIILSLFISGNDHLIKGVWATYLHGYNTASIGDARFFETRTVEAGEHQPWKISEKYNARELSSTLQETLRSTESVAFLIVKNDEIEYEQYWDDYSNSSHSNSFSMAKSIITMLIQIAIQDGIIDSWEDKVIEYLPDLQGPFRDELKLKHLSTMTAGLQWEENYTGPLGITARAYYGDDVKNLMYEQVPVVNEPGANFNYQSGSPQLLGMVLTKASGKTVSEFASEKLWKPMGASQNAYWHLDDKGGIELTYCCFNTNARDFARFGKLLINNGKWEGKSLIDSAFLAEAVSAQAVDYYGYSFWIDTDDHLTPVYFMRGILGQYVIVIPEKELLIIRLGHNRIAKKRDEHPEDFHIIVEEVLKYF